MDREEKIGTIIVMICLLVYMWVDTVETKSNNDRFGNGVQFRSITGYENGY